MKGRETVAKPGGLDGQRQPCHSPAEQRSPGLASFPDFDLAKFGLELAEDLGLADKLRPQARCRSFSAPDACAYAQGHAGRHFDPVAQAKRDENR